MQSKPDFEFIAYIDESGDPNLKRVRPIDDVGGTEWITLSAVLVRRVNDDKIAGWVSSINSAIGHANPQIIKFTKLSSSDKLQVCELASKLPLRMFVVASNKRNMRHYENPRAARIPSKQWFYNWLVRILVERVTDFCVRYADGNGLSRRHVKFVFSQTGGHSYSQTAAYHQILKYQARGGNMVLKRRMPRWEVMHWELVENFPHFKRAGLQLADVAASAFYHAVDNLDTGPCAPEFAKALTKVIARDELGVQADYGIVLQPTPDWAAPITDDQRAIFRHYGYKFRKDGR